MIAETHRFEFQPLVQQPIIDTQSCPSAGGNINGPSLIQSPSWLDKPLGRYYLYFAHHEGTSIRLAYANDLKGPWTIHLPGTLQLAESGFCLTPPKPEDTRADVLAMIEAGIEGDYPHIASPDVHLDEQAQQIHMFFHGRIDDGSQMTRLAISDDGLNFKVNNELLGRSYFRVFEHQTHYYAIALGGVLYRSLTGNSQYEEGHKLTQEKYRHGAILKLNNDIYVVFSRAEDCPERLLISRLDTRGSWHEWTLTDTKELHRPKAAWEGADEPLEASRFGGLMSRANQLRDPCVYQEEGRHYLVYSIAAEQGLAIGEIKLKA